MGQYSSEGKAERVDVVIREETISQSELIKCVVLGILNDEEGAKGQLGVGFGAAICFMGSSDAARY